MAPTTPNAKRSKFNMQSGNFNMAFNKSMVSAKSTTKIDELRLFGMVSSKNHKSSHLSDNALVPEHISEAIKSKNTNGPPDMFALLRKKINLQIK
jgi:hypothetical protein